MCTPFSRIPQAQLMRLDSFFSGALCVLSGGRLPEALFMVFYWIPKVQKYVPKDTYVHVVDLVKSFQTSIYYLVFTCKIWLPSIRERASQSCPKVRIEVRLNLGRILRAPRKSHRRGACEDHSTAEGVDRCGVGQARRGTSNIYNKAREC